MLYSESMITKLTTYSLHYALPIYHGKLKNSISYYPLAPLSFNVVCGVDYAAYLEWGTITHVHIPAGESAYAALYKDRKSTRLNSSHLGISYAVFCFEKKKEI